MRVWSISVVLLFIVGLGALVAWHPWRPSAATVWSNGPTVLQLEQLHDLVTARIQVADVLIGENQGSRGSWLVKGDALLGIELEMAQIVEKDNTSRQALVRLPLPRVLSARVDHERTRTWDVERKGLLPWKWKPDELRDEAMRNAQRLIEQAAASEGNIDFARHHAEAVIGYLYKMVDWTVTVQWQ